MRRITGRGRPVASAVLTPGRSRPVILLTVEGAPLAGERGAELTHRGLCQQTCAELTHRGCENVRQLTLKRGKPTLKRGKLTLIWGNQP